MEGESLNLISSLKPQMDACFSARCLWLKLMEWSWHRQEPSSATLLPSTTCMGRTQRRQSGTRVPVPILGSSPSSVFLHETQIRCSLSAWREGRRRGDKGRWLCYPSMSGTCSEHLLLDAPSTLHSGLHSTFSYSLPTPNKVCSHKTIS